jgi:hypothetical protein
LIGAVKDSVGELLAPNQIIYRDAFDGLKVDMRFTYGKGFFEAEAILRESPALPDGFKQESTVLQVVTEFIDPPTPDQRKPGILDFGAVQMIQGKAFSLSEQSRGPFVQSVNGKAAPVSKQWTQVGLRQACMRIWPMPP